jgi:hypothetical protein
VITPHAPRPGTLVPGPGRTDLLFCWSADPLTVLAVLVGQLTFTVISPWRSLDFSTWMVVPVPATTTLPPGLFAAS